MSDLKFCFSQVRARVSMHRGGVLVGVPMNVDVDDLLATCMRVCTLRGEGGMVLASPRRT